MGALRAWVSSIFTKMRRTSFRSVVQSAVRTARLGWSTTSTPPGNASKVPDNGRAHAPLDAIALDRLTQNLAGGDADARGDVRRSWQTWGLRGDKPGQERSKLLAAGLIDALIIGMAMQPPVAGLRCALGKWGLC